MQLPNPLPHGTPAEELAEGYERALRSLDEFHKQWLRIPFHPRDYCSSKNVEEIQKFIQAQDQRSRMDALLLELENYLLRHTVHLFQCGETSTRPETPAEYKDQSSTSAGTQHSEPQRAEDGAPGSPEKQPRR